MKFFFLDFAHSRKFFPQNFLQKSSNAKVFCQIFRVYFDTWNLMLAKISALKVHMKKFYNLQIEIVFNDRSRNGFFQKKIRYTPNSLWPLWNLQFSFHRSPWKSTSFPHFLIYFPPPLEYQLSNSTISTVSGTPDKKIIIKMVMSQQGIINKKVNKKTEQHES